ncbi:MAG: hypothetical protein LBL55_09115, partial [Propionibacteriaceae bacterium]|nr:hypothetical protein [Propionibacteriaceae bacterium]
DPAPARFVYHPGFSGCAIGLWPERAEAVVLLTNRLLAAAPALTIALWGRVLEAGGWAADLPVEGRVGGGPAQPEPEEGAMARRNHEA